MDQKRLTHLRQLEAESIHIIREVAAEFSNPVMMYSIGKDSSVMLHLARKAFYPGTLPFPLLHVDTGWKFREMYEFRDRTAKAYGCELLVHKNPEGVAMGINPFVHGSAKHTDIMKTEGLKQALNKYGFDAAFGGARRDEEKSRAKERIYSFRDRFHRWDPKNQRPELWHNYNGQINKGESIRVFPLSNWTELDIWQYGCWPLTGAVESNAQTLPEIIEEMLVSTTSERQGRVIDRDQAGSMELKKRQGYF
ncbi:sulfate adenylyltransferase subunit CysD [Enterobacter sp.]|uniref:sulfate adenylyltransferase subunit CysD n=1 Tax=Enterobacter sp. TaxID=42895 RepID=UPI002907B07F|nr:sulfate adenylyltransferase subunit CysD [Enterobacter sp.]MDU7342194.1 sulfate adenylyltransferase subunit CysD [Enterobacter sp.]